MTATAVDNNAMTFSTGIRRRHLGLRWMREPTHRYIVTGGRRLVPGCAPTPNNGNDPALDQVIALARLRDVLYVLSGVWDEWDRAGSSSWRADVGRPRPPYDPRINRLCRAASKSLGRDVGLAVEKWGTPEDRELAGRVLSGWTPDDDFDAADAMACRLVNSAMAAMPAAPSGRTPKPRLILVRKREVAEIMGTATGNGDFRSTRKKLARREVSMKPDDNPQMIWLDLNTLSRLDAGQRREIAALAPTP